MESREDIKVPAEGMKLGSGEGMVVEEGVDVVVNWLCYDAAIVVDDVLQACYRWQGNWNRLVAVVSWIFCDSGAYVVCV